MSGTVDNETGVEIWENVTETVQVTVSVVGEGGEDGVGWGEVVLLLVSLSMCLILTAVCLKYMHKKDNAKRVHEETTTTNANNTSLGSMTMKTHRMSQAEDSFLVLPLKKDGGSCKGDPPTPPKMPPPTPPEAADIHPSLEIVIPPPAAIFFPPSTRAIPLSQQSIAQPLLYSGDDDSHCELTAYPAGSYCFSGLGPGRAALATTPLTNLDMYVAQFGDRSAVSSSMLTRAVVLDIGRDAARSVKKNNPSLASRWVNLLHTTREAFVTTHTVTMVFLVVQADDTLYKAHTKYLSKNHVLYWPVPFAVVTTLSSVTGRVLVFSIRNARCIKINGELFLPSFTSVRIRKVAADGRAVRITATHDSAESFISSPLKVSSGRLYES